MWSIFLPGLLIINLITLAVIVPETLASSSQEDNILFYALSFYDEEPCDVESTVKLFLEDMACVSVDGIIPDVELGNFTGHCNSTSDEYSLSLFPNDQCLGPPDTFGTFDRPICQNAGSGYRLSLECDHRLTHYDFYTNSSEYLQFSTFYAEIDTHCTSNPKKTIALKTGECLSNDHFHEFDAVFFRNNYEMDFSHIATLDEFNGMKIYCNNDNMFVLLSLDANCENPVAGFSAGIVGSNNGCLESEDQDFHYRTVCGGESLLPTEMLGLFRLRENFTEREGEICDEQVRSNLDSANNADIPLDWVQDSYGVFYFYNPDACIESIIDDWGPLSRIVPGINATNTTNASDPYVSSYDGLSNSSWWFRGWCDPETAHMNLNLYFRDRCDGGSYAVGGDYHHCLLDNVTIGDTPEDGFVFFCMVARCNGISKFETETVCSGHGECVNWGECVCNEGLYDGENCEFPICFGISQQNESAVCSGRGICVSPDTCQCRSETIDSQVLSYEGGLGNDCSARSSIMLVALAAVGAVTFCGLIVGLAILVVVCCMCRNKKLKEKQKRFEAIDDIDLLLEEEEAYKRSGKKRPRVKVRRDLFEIPYEDIVLVARVGTGGSGAQVYKANWNQRLVAFKVFNCSKLEVGSGFFEEFEREVTLLSSVSHPSIVQFYGATLKEPRIGIVTEFCENGDLRSFLRQNADILDFPERKRILLEVLLGLNYLNEREIIHRDVKLGNILLNDQLRAKLIDFGLSKIVENAGTEAMQTKRVGTSYYMAPEVTVGKKYSSKCDVFSFAIVMFELLTNESPYPKKLLAGGAAIEFMVANDADFRPTIPDKFLQDERFEWYCDLMKLAWSHSAESRPTFSDMIISFQEESTQINFSDSQTQGPIMPKFPSTRGGDSRQKLLASSKAGSSSSAPVLSTSYSFAKVRSLQEQVDELTTENVDLKTKRSTSKEVELEK